MHSTFLNSRETRDFHPLADLFPLLEGKEFDELVADIKKNGLREPIALWAGKILDGRNRYRACIAAGFRPNFTHLPAVDPVTYVISANILRRHLTAEDKRKIIADLLKAQPEKSDRQIAETVRASPTTVGTVRREMESTVQPGQLPPKRIGKDGKSRKQPARTTRGKRTTSGLPEALAVVVGHDPAERPESTICEPLDPKQGASNPITRAWIKATKSQQIAFALDYREVIAGLSADEQRRLDERAANRWSEK
jgi:hypothetical protein